MTATLENQIKLLKAAEVDQMNAAKGYETLLADKIPLNEHFLILKNKYKKEKADFDKKIKELDDENAKMKQKNITLSK